MRLKAYIEKATGRSGTMKNQGCFLEITDAGRGDFLEEEPKRMEKELRARVLEYLRDHHVATLATSSGDDLWAAAVFYVSDGFTLYFLSSPTSRHCINLTQSPRVAVTIQEDYSDWLEIKGVQIEGNACEIFGEEEEKARRLYGMKFPVVGKLGQAPASIVKALAGVRWYQVVPHRLYFIDNSVGLGHRDQIDLPPSATKT